MAAKRAAAGKTGARPFARSEMQSKSVFSMQTLESPEVLGSRGARAVDTCDSCATVCQGGELTQLHDSIVAFPHSVESCLRVNLARGRVWCSVWKVLWSAHC